MRGVSALKNSTNKATRNKILKDPHITNNKENNTKIRKVQTPKTTKKKKERENSTSKRTRQSSNPSLHPHRTLLAPTQNWLHLPLIKRTTMRMVFTIEPIRRREIDLVHQILSLKSLT